MAEFGRLGKEIRPPDKALQAMRRAAQTDMTERFLRLIHSGKRLKLQ
jgi:hypothetical protein